MNYFGKTSTELSEKDFFELSELFNYVFHKNIDASFLKQKYFSPYLGFSFHGLMYSDEGNLVGALTFIPFSYKFFNTQVVAGSAADLMIHNNYRKDLLSFKNMYDQAVEKADNLLDFLYAVPNSNAYLYWTKFLKWREIGQINYYIQVLNISKIITKFKGFDWISNAFSSCSNKLAIDHVNRDNKLKYSIYKLSNTAYNDYRFKGQYETISESNKIAYYTIEDELGIMTAYIVDIIPFSGSWMRKVVKLIHAREKKYIDVIVYIGSNLNTQINLFKVPRKFEPRILHLIGKSLSEKVDDRIYNLDNWFFNLSNFDVR
jgi:hypothetical protein